MLVPNVRGTYDHSPSDTVKLNENPRRGNHVPGEDEHRTAGQRPWIWDRI